MNLTDEQVKILDHYNQNIYISASPGSGKSTVLSLIASKINTSCIDSNIVLISFTNKAAKTIIDKCKNINKDKISGGTFHSIAYRSMLSNSLNFHICDEYKKEVLIKKLFECKKDKNKFERVYEHISELKSKWPLDVNDEIIKKYQEELDKYNLLDFDDIIYKFIELVPTLNLPNYTHILVDELQDTSEPQLEMLKVLQKKLGSKVIGVADDDQILYRWRGARPENIQDFISLFGCKVLNMGHNFRSAKNIIEKSCNLIKHNKHRIIKKIQSTKDEDGIVSRYECNNMLEEISFVISKCIQNRDKEIAILYRNRVYKNHLELELRKNKLKYVVNDIFEITDRSAVKSMMSIMKIATWDFDIYDLIQATKALRGIGSATVEKINLEIKSKPLIDVVNEWIEDPKKRKKFQTILNIKQFFDANQNVSLDHLVRYSETQLTDSFDFQEDMKTFLLDVTKDYKVTSSSIHNLYNELGLDSREKEQDKDAKIELSTVHGFKGGERDIVILPWCQQYEPKNPEELEDERRVFYVAITRAMNKLYMSYSGEMPLFVKEMFNLEK